MKKIIGIGIAMVIVPWIVTLFWTGNIRGTFGEQNQTVSVTAESETTTAGENTLESEGNEKKESEQEVSADTVKASQKRTERRILLERDGIKTYMKLEDYLPGVMICQIPPEYEMEALKCQAIIARTYIHRLMENRTEIWEEELDLDYLGVNQINSAWDKEKTAENLERCRQAVQATAGVVMQYEERDILPLFHGISSGRTRMGEADYPYLQAAESRWDVDAPEYLQTIKISLSDFADKINQIPDAQPVSAQELPAQIQTVKKDDSGYIVEMKVGAKTYSGEAIQYALALKSPCFSIEGNSEGLTIVIKGSGHGYGLSQAGANQMALDGWNHEDILKYYYKNISIISA